MSATYCLKSSPGGNEVTLDCPKKSCNGLTASWEWGVEGVYQVLQQLAFVLVIIQTQKLKDTIGAALRLHI